MSFEGKPDRLMLMRLLCFQPSNLSVFHSSSGGVQRGDQVLNVEGVSLLGLTVEQAREELYKAMNRDTVICLILSFT